MRAIVSLAAIATLMAAALVIQTARPVRPETLLLRVPGCIPLLRQRRLQCERSCRARGRAQSLSEIETLAGAAPSTIQIHLDGVRVYPSYGCSSVSPWEWFDIFHRASPSLAPYWKEGEGGPAVGQEFVPATCECVGSVPLPAVESDAEENAEAEVEADNANDGASPEHGSLPAGEAAQQDKPADGTMREASRDSSVQSWLQPHAQEPGLRAGAASLCAPRDCTAGDGGVRHGNTAPLPSPPPPPLPSLCRDFDRWVIHTVASVKIAAEERTCFWRRPGRQGLGLCRARCRRPSMGSTRRPHQAGAWHAQVHAHEHVARTDVTTA